MGEYQALLHLHAHSKVDVTPMIDIPEIGYDFETGQDAKTIDEHLERFGTRLAEKWGNQWVFVDLRLIDPIVRMADGRHPLSFVLDDVRNHNALAMPTTGLGRDEPYQEAVVNAISQDHCGACIRLTIEDIAASQFQSRLASLLMKLQLELEQCHLILDLGAPNFQPLEGFTKMVQGLIKRLPDLDRWMTYTIMGTSFPKTMGELKIGVQILKRYEWLFYKKLLRGLAPRERKPAFGDYAIAHPEYEPVDPRLIKPAASIRYAIDDAWYIVKGQNVRDHGSAQYATYCAALLKSGLFLGAGFSDAGEYIRKCAQRRLKPGNLTSWRRVGTNHHIEKAVFDLSNLHGS